MFKKAVKSRAKLRLALIGPSGSGKTYSALAIASGLGERVAVIDTEHGSASLYADEFGFDVLELTSFAPQRYVEAIRAAEEAGYDVVVIDSLSHAWCGKDGALEMVDTAQRKQKSPNSFTAWREVTPQHTMLVDAIVQSKCHVIACMRAKTEYSQEKDERGKTVIRKVGLAPVQRDGLDYEFTVVGDLDLEHTMVVTKSRCKALADQAIRKPGVDVAHTLLAWLNDGAEPALPPKPAATVNNRTPFERFTAALKKLADEYGQEYGPMVQDAYTEIAAVHTGDVSTCPEAELVRIFEAIRDELREAYPPAI